MSKFDLDIDGSIRKVTSYLTIPTFYLDLKNLDIKGDLIPLKISERYLGLKGIVWMGVEGLEGEFLMVHSIPHVLQSSFSDPISSIQETVRMITVPTFPSQELLFYVCRGRLKSEQILLARVVVGEDFETNFDGGITLTPIELSMAWWQVRLELTQNFRALFKDDQ